MINIFVLASLGIFLALMFGRTVMLSKRGIKVWVINKSSKHTAKKILEILLVPGLILFFGLIIASATGAFSFPHLWDSRFTNTIGLVLCYIGLAIFFGALLSFGEAWRIGIDDKNSDNLITGGLFSVSRNPVFLFMDMYWLGIALIYPTIIFISLLIVFAVGTHMQILSEESFLKKKFGKEYEDYCKKVRRYL